MVCNPHKRKQYSAPYLIHPHRHQNSASKWWDGSCSPENTGRGPCASLRQRSHPLRRVHSRIYMIDCYNNELQWNISVNSCPFAVWYWLSPQQEVEFISPLFESRLALWFALTTRMWQKRHSFLKLGMKSPCPFALVLLECFWHYVRKSHLTF